MLSPSGAKQGRLGRSSHTALSGQSLDAVGQGGHCGHSSAWPSLKSVIANSGGITRPWSSHSGGEETQDSEGNGSTT